MLMLSIRAASRIVVVSGTVMLLWKSYLAGCIANALMEKEIPVHMTNFALILNDLAASFENRNEYISRLCRYPLLIIDDFGAACRECIVIKGDGFDLHTRNLMFKSNKLF